LKDPLLNAQLGQQGGGAAPSGSPLGSGTPGSFAGKGGAAATAPAPEPLSPTAVADSLKSEHYKKFVEAMAPLKMEEKAVEGIWTDAMKEVVKSHDRAAAAEGGPIDLKSKDLIMSAEGYQKLVQEYKVPQALRAAFKAEVDALPQDSKVALWSGTTAKEAAAKSGYTFLEGTPLGKPFNDSGIPIPGATVHWAAISKAYAETLGDAAQKLQFVGFVDAATRGGSNIAKDVELPALAPKLEKAEKSVEWRGAASILDSKAWVGQNDVFLSGRKLTKEPGFWAIGKDRQAVINASKEPYEALVETKFVGVTTQAGAPPPETPAAPESGKPAS
jgi:hypothetical protein